MNAAVALASHDLLFTWDDAIGGYAANGSGTDAIFEGRLAASCSTGG